MTSSNTHTSLRATDYVEPNEEKTQNRMEILHDNPALTGQETTAFAVCRPKVNKYSVKAIGFYPKGETHLDSKLIWVPKSVCNLVKLGVGAYSLTVAQWYYDKHEDDMEEISQ